MARVSIEVSNVSNDFLLISSQSGDNAFEVALRTAITGFGGISLDFVPLPIISLNVDLQDECNTEGKNMDAVSSLYSGILGLSVLVLEYCKKGSITITDKCGSYDAYISRSYLVENGVGCVMVLVTDHGYDAIVPSSVRVALRVKNDDEVEFDHYCMVTGCCNRSPHAHTEINGMALNGMFHHHAKQFAKRFDVEDEIVILPVVQDKVINWADQVEEEEEKEEEGLKLIKIHDDNSVSVYIGGGDVAPIYFKPVTTLDVGSSGMVNAMTNALRIAMVGSGVELNLNMLSYDIITTHIPRTTLKAPSSLIDTCEDIARVFLYEAHKQVQKSIRMVIVSVDGMRTVTFPEVGDDDSDMMLINLLVNTESARTYPLLRCGEEGHFIGRRIGFGVENMEIYVRCIEPSDHVTNGMVIELAGKIELDALDTEGRLTSEPVKQLKSKSKTKKSVVKDEPVRRQIESKPVTTNTKKPVYTRSESEPKNDEPVRRQIESKPGVGVSKPKKVTSVVRSDPIHTVVTSKPKIGKSSSVVFADNETVRQSQLIAYDDFLRAITGSRFEGDRASKKALGVIACVIKMRKEGDRRLKPITEEEDRMMLESMLNPNSTLSPELIKFCQKMA